ncbi:GntR family transcriptional regulator [Rhodococcus sp. APC 3903]|uniref:GntR family transcriptional regulator n=1 Tax=Rhodococcus sp. APC 3903 TaxID=3035193 RepID=UPI0025B5767B|nr:GntR family transcriptional regulator [Rhodococcus sp. APC 3903]MDN3459885.1 GntR family transcriptional regulator [Rhodococcus sp. APC 3903]
MLIRLTPNENMPLHEQIAHAVRDGILNGSVADGERLPSAKALGESLGVSLHTVLRAYQALRDAGLIDLRRGRGAVVTALSEPSRAKATRILDEAVCHLNELGLPPETVLALFRSRLERAQIS